MHVAIGLRDANVIKEPSHSMETLREACKVIQNPPPLLPARLLAWLNGTHHLGELDAILNEKDRPVVSHHVVVSFLGVKLDGKTPGIAEKLGGVFPVGHCAMSHCNRGGLSLLLQEVSHGHIRKALGHSESPCQEKDQSMKQKEEVQMQGADGM